MIDLDFRHVKKEKNLTIIRSIVDPGCIPFPAKAEFDFTLTRGKYGTLLTKLTYCLACGEGQDKKLNFNILALKIPLRSTH
jgi:hypothetical protein